LNSLFQLHLDVDNVGLVELLRLREVHRHRVQVPALQALLQSISALQSAPPGRFPANKLTVFYCTAKAASQVENRKVDLRLPGKGNSDSHGARPVHQIITMIKWIRTSRVSIKNSLFENRKEPFEEHVELLGRVFLRQPMHLPHSYLITQRESSVLATYWSESTLSSR